MKVLTLVPVRGGSKGVPGKNIKQLGGKPLIAHTIDAALGAGLSPVVTTDDEALARGAVCIEKHLTLDQQLPGPDHAASLEPEAFTHMVAMIREVEAGLGHGRKEPMPGEEEMRQVAKR